MAEQVFRTPIVDGATRYIQGSSGRLLGTDTQIKENAQMARLEGTGKDPLGRYGKGEIFDVPKYITTPDGVIDSDGDLKPNPLYQDLLDKGWAKEVKPEDDPGRTVTQIADTLVSQDGSLAHPVDAAIAAKVEDNAYAIVHTGDPNASADGDLKTDAIRESQPTAKRQYGADQELGEVPEEESSGDGEESGSSRSSRSGSRSGS